MTNTAQDQSVTGSRANAGDDTFPKQSLAEARPYLARPLPSSCIEYLPDSVERDATEIKLFPFLKVPSLQNLLDYVVSPECWSSDITLIDARTLRCVMRLFDVTHGEIGQGVTRYAQSANAFKRASRHFGIGRYLTYLEPLVVPLGSSDGGVRLLDAGRVHISEQMLVQFREIYAGQIAELGLGPMFEHPLLGLPPADDTPVIVSPATEPSIRAPAPEPAPSRDELAAAAGAIGMSDGRLANLMLEVGGRPAKSEDEAAALLEELFARIPPAAARRTLGLLEVMGSIRPQPSSQQRAPAPPRVEPAPAPRRAGEAPSAPVTASTSNGNGRDRR